MGDNRKVVRVNTASEKAIRAYAEKKGLTVGDAADALISTGVSRLAALAKYAKHKDPLPPGKPRKSPPRAKKKAAAKPRVKAEANGAAAHEDPALGAY